MGISKGDDDSSSNGVNIRNKNGQTQNEHQPKEIEVGKEIINGKSTISEVGRSSAGPPGIDVPPDSDGSAEDDSRRSRTALHPNTKPENSDDKLQEKEALKENCKQTKPKSDQHPPPENLKSNGNSASRQDKTLTNGKSSPTTNRETVNSDQTSPPLKESKQSTDELQNTPQARNDDQQKQDHIAKTVVTSDGSPNTKKSKKSAISDSQASLSNPKSIIVVSEINNSAPRKSSQRQKSAGTDKNANEGRTKLTTQKSVTMDSDASATDGPQRLATQKSTIQNQDGGQLDTDNAVVPLDEIDAPYRKIDAERISVFSLYMERDFRYYFQHPYLRLIIAYLVTFCNFLIYAEDPVAHSIKECYIPVVGNCFAFVCTRYPDSGWSLIKVILWLTAILCGLVIGKMVIHKLLFGRLFRLKMFADDQGSWITMFFTVILFVFTFSYVYNAILLIGGEPLVQYHISSLMGIRNSVFMKAAACGTWCGDFFTAWMVTDIMLQEKLYPEWAVSLRRWWNKGYNRIILFWSIVTTTSIIVVTVISTDVILWDKLNRDFLPTNELSRSYLASFILVMDLLILMQDWDFPHFINNFDIKLPGINVAEVKFKLPKYLLKESYTVHITGKWFNYGIIFIVMLLDLNMWKNQIFYEPFEYGQYTNGTGKIFSIRDDYSLENHNASQMTYEWRSTNINPVTNLTYIDGDMDMNSRYYGISLAVKCTAFIPSIAAFICIGALVYMFGRFRPTEQDPYAGRLKKRKKKSKRRKSSVRICKDGGPAVVFDGKNYVAARTNQSYPENWKP